MQPHPRIRKTVKWGGAVVSVLLLVVWVASGWWYCGLFRPNGLSVHFKRGRACLISLPSWPGINRFHGRYNPGFTPDFEWRIDWEIQRNAWSAFIPLWLPLSATLATTALAWHLDTLARRRAMAHLCSKCRYDRTGLAPGAVCPECGEAPKAG